MADVSVDEAVRTLRTLYEEVRMAHHPGWQINPYVAKAMAEAGDLLNRYDNATENEHGC